MLSPPPVWLKLTIPGTFSVTPSPEARPVDLRDEGGLACAEGRGSDARRRAPRSLEALIEQRLRACPVAFVGDRPAEPQLGIPRTAEVQRSWPSRSPETSGR